MGATATGRPVVVKVGGSCLDDLAPDWWDALAELRARDGDRLIVVHGWSKMLAGAAPEGQPDFIVDKHGFRSRYTTPAVLEQIERVAADLRERIAALLGERGLRTAAVSGAGERLLRAEVRRNMWWVGDDLVELTNLVGPVRSVDGERLAVLLDGVDALVVSPLAVAATGSALTAAAKLRTNASTPSRVYSARETGYSTPAFACRTAS